jgi:hypothetical protein
MKKRAVCFLFVMIAFAASVALAEPQQWRAADGGNDHWYEVVVNTDAQGRPAPVTWEHAKAAADARAGNWHLVSITSAAENDFVFNLSDDPDCWVLSNGDYFGPWIGAYQFYSQYLWDNGEQFDYANWRTGGPSVNGDDYVHFLGNNQRENTWNDLSDENSVLPAAYIVETSDQNRPPVLSPIGNKSVREGETLLFSIDASDRDGDNFTFAAANVPAGAYFNPNSRQFRWVTGYGDAGNYEVTFTVTDDGDAVSLSDSETVTLSVGDVNRPPVLAAIGSKHIDEGATMVLSISATDPDGDNLDYATGSLPIGTIFDAETQTFSWTTDSSDAGNYLVTFTVTDDGSPPLTDSETVPITVGDVNQPPVMGTIGNRAVSERELLEFRVTASDADGDSLFFDAGDLPAGAAFDPATHVFSWQPTYEDQGNHYITFTLTDSGSPPLSDAETTIITVGNVNRPPVMTVTPNQSVGLGELLEFAVSAFDSDNHDLFFTVDNLPHGASFDGASRTFRWMPSDQDRDVGNHLVTFTAIDDGIPSLRDSKEVTITVGNVNRPPVLGKIGNKVVATDQLLVFAVTATDPDNDTLEFSVQGLADDAVFDESRQVFYWLPTSEDIGLYILRFSVVDVGSPPLSDEIVVDVEVVESAITGAGDGGSREEPDAQPPAAEIVVKGGSGGGCFINLSAN